ncbi:cd99 antigen-like [Limosa lapponica baueri]|uniref:Cd99 antigen-like n=1 Tax=Limosa lapponica baueri TaxID=1758121 RepID=A0A2I0TSH6_LIMLA|nr:cd99 antigen-like [Limosa lapponica baueri]
MVKGLDGKTYEDQMRSLGLEKRRPRGALMAVYTFLTGGSGAGGADLSLVTSDRTQENGMKLRQGKFRLGIRKSSFTERWSAPGTGSSGKRSWPQACQSSRSVCTMLLVMWFSFRWSCEEQGVGFCDLGGPFPARDIL